LPLTITLDYLRDDVLQKMEQFEKINKMIERNINDDVYTLNEKLGNIK